MARLLSIAFLAASSLACSQRSPTATPLADSAPAAASSDGNVPASGAASEPLSPAASPAGSPAAPELAAGPRFIGRVSPTAKLLTWSGSAVEARFTGTGGTAQFRNTTGSSFVAVSIDAAEPTKVAVVDGSAIPFGPVPEGNHVVRLTKASEADLGTLTLVSLASDGNLLPTPAPSRRLLFVGASMTLGYGVDGVDPCTNTAATENALEAWTQLTATALQADATLIARSGYGLLRNAVGNTDAAVMPTIFERAAPGDPSKPYDFPPEQVPQAVVINLGNNDFSFEGSGSIAARAPLDQAAFTAAYLTFVRSLRSRYKDAIILLTNSAMLSDSTAEKQHTSLLAAITAVRTQANDPNVRTLDIPSQTLTPFGCNGHPNKAEHEQVSALVAPVLKTALGW